MPGDPRTRIALNGMWQVQPSHDPTPPTTWNHTVPVPALVDIAEPSYNWKDQKYHYYRTTFDVLDASALAFIVIEQAMFGTGVWLNGEHLGGDIACYTSQEYDVRHVLNAEGRNELIVRVGQKEDLPARSAVGKDQERIEWIPGIWGDVYLTQCGNPRVRLVQVIPHIESASAEIRVTVENCTRDAVFCTLSSGIIDKQSGTHASEVREEILSLDPHNTATSTRVHRIADIRLWSPEDPHLYEVETVVAAGGRAQDSLRTTFGMREFKIVGSDFHLNGKPVFLRGGNIAFHRFLSDADRGTLPWNLEWVKRLLIDIPRAHNFNFFRNHIGQMYNRWYDIADEHGMLLQNEWMFWTTTGTKEQITEEFTRWLHDNWNHPSIIIWDALNECSDEVVQKEIVPEMKRIDPTRPWESVDFVEDHPYIYSLGPVLNSRKLGFTRSLDEIEESPAPSVVNEFLWWWLDNRCEPALLTKEVAGRWLGTTYAREDLVNRQCFLAQELVELFRRMRVDAIQPFVYLSNNAGPTAHWFLDDIRDLKPKPVLQALKNAFAPFGLSIELWDRHFAAGEQRTMRLFVFNDHSRLRKGKLRYGIVDGSGNWHSQMSNELNMEACDCRILDIRLQFPAAAGTYFVMAELTDSESADEPAFSRKIAHVFAPFEVSEELGKTRVAIHDDAAENRLFLQSHGIRVEDVHQAHAGQCDVLVIGEGMLCKPGFGALAAAITTFIDAGKTVIVLEPELRVERAVTVAISKGLDVHIEPRADADRGGYDSYVFAEDHGHPVWAGISKEHLQMFNGAFGGEAVSQHDVSISASHDILARCGLHLRVLAAAEAKVGRGRVIISRVQTRGRLVGNGLPSSLFDRRTDPVAQRLLVNLLAYATGKQSTLQSSRASKPESSHP